VHPTTIIPAGYERLIDIARDVVLSVVGPLFFRRDGLRQPRRMALRAFVSTSSRGSIWSGQPSNESNSV
jgi:hypothetical protein